MANINIVNAAPMVIPRGTQDVSGRSVAREEQSIATLIPLVPIYTAKGPARALVKGSDRERIFGADSFDQRKEFATHQTEVSNITSEGGGTQMIVRVEPNDIGPAANFTLWLDVLETQVKQYKRTASGAFELDDMGDKIEVTPAATLPGLKIKPVVTNVSALSDENKFGTLLPELGDQVEGGVTSRRYPVLQFWASSRGKIFNNSGARMWAPVENATVPIDTNLLESVKAYPFRMAVMERASLYDTAKPVDTQYGEQFINFVLKPDTVDLKTNIKVSLQDIFLEHYTNTSNNGQPLDYGHFGGVKVYNEYIEHLVKIIYANEVGKGSASDFSATATDGEEWLVNLLGAHSSKGEPYYTVEMVTDSNSVTLNDSTTIFAAGGSDGTMFEVGKTYRIDNGTRVNFTTEEIEASHYASYAGLVENIIAEYANPNSPVMDTATNVESILVDSGWPLRTKRKLAMFIAERKDLFVILSTYDVNGGPMTASGEYSTAIALRSYLKSYAESDYYGTATMRGMVVGRYGRRIGTQYKKKLPLTLEVLRMAVAMMGASSGKWNSEKKFDCAENGENNIISGFEDLSVTFTPSRVRNRDWSIGLNWAQKYDIDRSFFPALQTIYDDDTSVLNSFFAAMCCVELQKVGERVWRRFSGVTDLTNEQLIDRVNKAVYDRTLGRFCDMFVIKPQAQITAADERRNYSWLLTIEMYANGMKTVMVLDVRARRMSDLTSA